MAGALGGDGDADGVDRDADGAADKVAGAAADTAETIEVPTGEAARAAAADVTQNVTGSRLIGEPDGGGIGGKATARRGSLPLLKIGGQHLTQVPASFVVDRGGPLTNPYLAGTLGAALLSGLSIAIDIDRRRLAFLPNESPDLTRLATAGKDF